MEVTGRFELPEELLELERSGINEASTFEMSRARRAASQATSPPLGATSTAHSDYGLDGESSRYTHNASVAERQLRVQLQRQ